MKHSQNLSTFNLLKYSIFTIFLNMNCTLDSSSNSDLFLLIFSPLYITIQFFHKIFHSTSHSSLKIRSEYQNFTHFYFFSTFFSIYFWIKLYSLIYALLILSFLLTYCSVFRKTIIFSCEKVTGGGYAPIFAYDKILFKAFISNMNANKQF